MSRILEMAETPASRTSASQTPTSQSPASNVLEVTVGELSGALKRMIEDRFGFVRVRGEISNYRGPHSSGHAYFCLKDDTARIDAVVWKTAFARLKTKPQEGLEVIATGRVTTFPGKSTYQIVIEAIEPAGIGALMAILEARRKTLAGEGLFDDSRKRALPFLPRTIGVVTSPTGAVIRDILHRIAERFSRDVLVWPVRVQGETAAEEVAAGIAGFNALAPGGAIARPDVLIIARGGGSLEDLWAFNEEVVVRAAAASAIPLISAVGHETDWTLIDHAADLRAPTPSGAAEKAVPVRRDLVRQQAGLSQRLDDGIHRLVGRLRGDARALARALPAAEAVLAMARQRLERADARLLAARKGGQDKRRLDLVRIAHRLSHQAPKARLTQRQHELTALERRMAVCVARDQERRIGRVAQSGQRLDSLRSALRRDLARAGERRQRAATALLQQWSAGARLRRDHIERCAKLLGTLGYKQVLSRGFALVRDEAGRPVHGMSDAQAAVTLDIEFRDGHILARPNSSGRSGRPAKPVAKADQGSLF